jgi:hypothetical protein
MYFADAKKAFQENLQMIDPQRDPVGYNLNSGLLRLVSGMEAEFHALKRRVAAIEDQLQSRR